MSGGERRSGFCSYGDLFGEAEGDELLGKAIDIHGEERDAAGFSGELRDLLEITLAIEEQGDEMLLLVEAMTSAGFVMHDEIVR